MNLLAIVKYYRLIHLKEVHLSCCTYSHAHVHHVCIHLIENQHMIDYHQICFNKITDNQSEIKQMLSEVIRRFDSCSMHYFSYILSEGL